MSGRTERSAAAISVSQSPPIARSRRASRQSSSSVRTTAAALLLTMWTRNTSASSSMRRTVSPKLTEGLTTSRLDDISSTVYHAGQVESMQDYDQRIAGILIAGGSQVI